MGRRDFSREEAVRAEPLLHGFGDDGLLGKGLVLAHLAVSRGPDQRRRELRRQAEGHGDEPGCRHGFCGLGGLTVEFCCWERKAGSRR